MGSSIGNKKDIIQAAFVALQTMDQNARLSVLYENEAWGGVAKNTFVNAVCELHTELSPQNFLEYLHTIEKAFGRTRMQKWEDRTLDLDILFFGTEKIQTPTLTIPHPGIMERESVLVPLKNLIGNDMFMKKLLLNSI